MDPLTIQMTQRRRGIIDIKARELEVGDSLGEGQTVSWVGVSDPALGTMGLHKDHDTELRVGTDLVVYRLAEEDDHANRRYRYHTELAHWQKRVARP